MADQRNLNMPPRPYLRQGKMSENWREDGRATRKTGLHSGKGPKTYQRPDSRIEEDINDRLCEDPYVDATDIDVTVDHGEIILTGKVEDKNSKRRAEDVAESVIGVKNVENRLRTRLPGELINNNEEHKE